MGIQADVQAMLRILPLPRPFSVCELGDQGLCGEGKNQPAEPFYIALGCTRYVSIDGNGRGTITADLNYPMNHWSHRQILIDNGPFDLVTDFGTGEHIFNQAEVWRTLHALVKTGGLIAFDRPAQGYEKHCYYLTNEGLYTDIAEANAYAVIAISQASTPRGRLVRGVFRRTTGAPFRMPNQSRYRRDLKI